MLNSCGSPCTPTSTPGSLAQDTEVRYKLIAGDTAKSRRMIPGGRRPGLREQLPARLRAHPEWFSPCRNGGAERAVRSARVCHPGPAEECPSQRGGAARAAAGAVRPPHTAINADGSSPARSRRRPIRPTRRSSTTPSSERSWGTSASPSQSSSCTCTRTAIPDGFGPATSARAKPAKPPASIPIPPILRAS